MKITIEFKKKEEMRIPGQNGDWEETADGIFISVIKTPFVASTLAVAVHELTECLLCQKDGISQKIVDHWDLEHENEDDPGLLENAPYHEQHMKALEIERCIVEGLGLTWLQHEFILEATLLK